MRIIDIHTHGIGSYDTKGATPQDILRIAGIHGSQGVSAIIPTIYSGPIDEMRADIAAVKKAMEIQKSGVGACPPEVWRRDQGSGIKKPSKYDETCGLKPAVILGVHLEGPFLNPARAGALDGNSFLPMELSHYKKLIEGFCDVVKIITVAPELDGASRLVRTIADAGIIVSMGHSNATYSEAEAGFNAGAKGITHIFNAMRGIHHREPGIAGFGLLNPHAYVEVIADPFHLHPKIIELIFGTKKPEKIIIVSDSVKTGQTGTAAQSITDSTGSLLGGSMAITESVQYLIGLGFQKNIIERCISDNPEMYLTDGPSLVVSL
jgi:N-acetylglucosamine-6-phosphate deacetylase